MWIPLPSALTDVHFCGVDTAWLWDTAYVYGSVTVQAVLLCVLCLPLVLFKQYNTVGLFSDPCSQKDLYAKKLALNTTLVLAKEKNPPPSYTQCEAEWTARFSFYILWIIFLAQSSAQLNWLTTGRWTSQKALSWLSRIFLSALSFFLSILWTETIGNLRCIFMNSYSIRVILVPQTDNNLKNLVKTKSSKTHRDVTFSVTEFYSLIPRWQHFYPVNLENWYSMFVSQTKVTWPKLV